MNPSIFHADRLHAASRLLPGLLLVAALCGLAFLLVALPGMALLGTLGITLLAGITWRLLAPVPKLAEAGVSFTAKTVLRLGIVMLGVRLDFGLLYAAGLQVLLLDLLVIAVGMAAIVLVSRWLGLPRRLGLLLAAGSSICGASAIAAAAPIVGAEESEVSQAVGIISVLGALGVIAFAIAGPLLDIQAINYGLLTGSTLQEVGHVLAAGAAGGELALDAATVTKLTRVALLAPVLVLLSLQLRRGGRANGGAVGVKTPVLPGFLVGFLLVGVASSLNLIPEAGKELLQGGSLLLTTAAMGAIGLGVDPQALRRTGLKAATVATGGFVVIVGVAVAYLWL